MDYASLKKLLPFLEKDLPEVVGPASRDLQAAAESSIPATVTKDAEVVGQGASSASPKGLPIQDADILTQQANQGPNPAQLSVNLDPTSQGTGIASKWQQLKSAAPYVGAAGAGAGLAMLQGDGSTPSQSPKVSSPMAPKAAPMTDSDEDEDEETPSAPAAKSTKATSSEDESEEAPSAPATKPSAPDLSNPNLASVQKLRDLQQQMQQQLNLNNAGRNMAATTYAMAGKANPFDKQFEDQAKQAGLPVEQYLQQAEFQKQDPNSPMSKAYRDLAKSIYPDMPISDQLSAADLEKVNPELGQIRTREDMIKMRADAAQDRNNEQHYRNQMLQLQMQDRQTQKQQAQEQKQQQLDSKRLDTYSAKMALPSSRTVLGQAQSQIFSVDRVDALLNGHGDLNNLTPQEVVEVAKGLDRVISGGASTLEGSKTLNPDTAKQFIANQMQKITNAPQGAGGGAFLSRIQGNLQREKQTAIKQAGQMYQTLLAGSGDLAKRNPEAFGDFLDKSGVNPELKDYLMTGKKPLTIKEQQQAMQNSGVNAVTSSAAPSSGNQKDPKIDAYAQQNDLDYDHASAILKARGYNAQ